MDNPNLKRPFWAWVFCEPDGTPSFARVGTAVLAAFVCGWVTAIVRWTHALPSLGEAVLFITALYGANKFSTMFNRQG